MTNKKQNIFTTEYDNLFCTDRLLSPQTVEYIKSYYDIKNRYKLSQGYCELKVFFIIYLSVKLRRFDYDKLIEEFDSFVSSPTTSNLKPSRKLIQPSFLNEVNSHFNINT